jgi:hypothetical protein
MFTLMIHLLLPTLVSPLNNQVTPKNTIRTIDYMDSSGESFDTHQG